MEKINDAVAANLRQIREKRKMSLDSLSAATGVSKSMLAQIERGNANPTISTLWKIASGLKLSFSQLVTRQEQDVEIVAMEELDALLEDGGRFRNYPVFPFEEQRPFEIYRLELDPGAQLRAAAHPHGTQEYILVSEGVVEVSVGERRLVADTAHAVRFKADLPHSYRNGGDRTCSMTMVISYAQAT